MYITVDGEGLMLPAGRLSYGLAPCDLILLNCFFSLSNLDGDNILTYDCNKAW
jgi:hypothetical protein